MDQRALSEALLDFSPRLATPPRAAAAQPSPTSEADRREREHADRLDAEVAAARAQAEQEAAARLDAEVTRLKEEHAAQLAALSASLATEAGSAIAATLTAAEEQLVQTTTATVARLLSAHLTGTLRSQAVDGLAAVIRKALHDDEAVRIDVTGIASLYEPLKTALGPLAAQLRFTEGPAPDLSVRIDDTVYETRLAEWAGRIDEVVG